VPAAAPSAAPAAPPAAAAAPSAPAKPATAAAEIEERLATLKRLRERDLISEAEYQQKRRELLDRL
jgi:hypothetical protein